MSSLQIGILALQGDFSAHQTILESLGARVKLVRVPTDLQGLDGLLIPGGESTVMSRLCERYELIEPLRAQIGAGMPTFGTCAGLIFLSKTVAGTSQNFPQQTLAMLDVGVERNAYGAQIDSFEVDLAVATLETPIHAVFIRAPRIKDVGEGVEVLARFQDAPVIVRQGAILALSFHPEIAGERRVHQMWLESIQKLRDNAENQLNSADATADTMLGEAP